MNGEIKIEKNIPIPDKGRADGGYPWRQMEVGDSFLVAKRCNVVSLAACSFSKRNPGYKFTCRTTDGGTRVWRVK